MAQTTLPAPIVVPASGVFEGFDGLWSTFNFTLGSTGQLLHLLPSTRIAEIVVVDNGVCDNSPLANCSSIRGGTFDISQSKTWQGNGTFAVTNEPGLDDNRFNGKFGFDTISVPGPNSKPISLDGQLIASGNTSANLLELGLLPLSPGGNALPSDPTPIPSYLTSLRTANMIPGSGFGYTAGAAYENTYGSLVLGGYDDSRYTPNDIKFTFGPNSQPQVGIQQIVYTDDLGTKQPVLISGGILAVIDSTIPDLWLPLDSCGAIQKAFGLKSATNTLRYTIDDDARQTALKNNASVTFTIGNTADSGTTTDITLPYKAFDLALEPPLASSSTRYFPLRQATNGPSQFTLGRTFLQSAYLLANFEQRSFNVYQAIFPPGQAHILPISAGGSAGSSGSQPSGTSTASPSPTNTGLTITHSSGGGLPNSAIAGITIAVLAVAAILAGIAIWVMCRKRKQKKRRNQEISELQANNEDKGYYGGVTGGRSDQQHGQGHALKPSVTVSEVDGAGIGQRQLRNDTEPYHDVPVELDEGAPRTEMESSVPTSPARSPRLGNLPTYIEMPSPTVSRQSTGLPSPPADDTQSISQALSHQHFHSTRQSPISSPSPADEIGSQIGSPQIGSAFQSPQMGAVPSRFGHPSLEGQLPPFNLNHSPPALSPVELPSPRPSPGPESHSVQQQNSYIHGQAL